MVDDEDGTYVERSGLAVVHQGERIVSAPGSAAVLRPDPPGQAAHYYFEVEVVMVGDLGEELTWRLERQIWQRLHDALA
jgi:hypothetical protein